MLNLNLRGEWLHILGSAYRQLKRGSTCMMASAMAGTPDCGSAYAENLIAQSVQLRYLRRVAGSLSL